MYEERKKLGLLLVILASIGYVLLLAGGNPEVFISTITGHSGIPLWSVPTRIFGRQAGFIVMISTR